MGLSINFWTNRHILITGAGGFVGSHLTKKLNELGADVISMVRRENGVDVTDRKAFEAFIIKKPSVVFHLAGEALVEKGQEVPYETFQTNVMGTLNVLELSRIYHIPRIIIASTAHVYGAGQPPFIEDDPPLCIEREKNLREGEIADQYVSWEKASRVLGWGPHVSLSEGLARTITWYKDYFSSIIH